jgi:hypothetical protein
MGGVLMAIELTSRNVILWVPRILCLAFAAFLSIFALDALTEQGSFAMKMAALAIHLIPTFGVLLVLWACWRREWIGVIVFRCSRSFTLSPGADSIGRPTW